MKKFKIRASKAGAIMTNPRKGHTGLSKTSQSFVFQWIKEQIYNRPYEFYSKYTDRGNASEEAGIKLIAKFLNLGYIIKNEEYFENEYFTGTPDIILSDTVIDVKCSWDCFTFPLFETTTPNPDHADQLQVYMELTGKEKAILAYTLNDMPGHLLEREARYKANDLGLVELEPEQEQEVIARHTYSNLPYNLRVKTFPIKKDPERIEQIKNRVIECREFITDLMDSAPVVKSIKP